MYGLYEDYEKAVKKAKDEEIVLGYMKILAKISDYDFITETRYIVAKPQHMHGIIAEIDKKGW